MDVHQQPVVATVRRRLDQGNGKWCQATEKWRHNGKWRQFIFSLPEQRRPW
jgi:hypothetical protein